MAKGDSATSDHYWREQDAHVLSDIQDSLGPSVLIPNGATIASTKKGTLPLSNHLTTEGSTAKILPGLSSASLVSLGKLCDDDCKVFLDKKNLIAVKDDEIILEGKRNKYDGLWDIPIYKTGISQNSCKLPSPHPSIYPRSEIWNPIHKAQQMVVPKLKKKKHRLNKILR